MAKDRLLARAAERMYWLGRYVERSENTARLLNVYGNLLFDLPIGVEFGFGTLIDIMGAGEDFHHRLTQRSERNVSKYLLSDLRSPSSVIASVTAARENARTSRELIPQMVWEQINSLHYFVSETAANSLARRARGEFLHEVIGKCQQFSGSLDATMSHDSAYQLIRIGQLIERTDMTSRIIDIGAVLDRSTMPENRDQPVSYESSIWLAVLISTSALQMYRRHFSEKVERNDAVQFLLQDATFPRAVFYCLKTLEAAVDTLPDNGNVQRVIASVRRKVATSDFSEISDADLNDLCDDVQLRLANVHQIINSNWFGHRD